MEGWLITTIAVVVTLARWGSASIYDDTPEEVCTMAPDQGVCRAKIPSWFYNETSGLCEEFIYGGCEGNNNRFATREHCIKRCNPEVCALPPDTGNCRANIRMFFYDHNDWHCKQFSYGGCDGNENRFPSHEACIRGCAGTHLPCEFGETFEKIHDQAVKKGFKEEDWFTRSCDTRCKAWCVEEHTWGMCLAYSVRDRWYGCNCYIFDRQVSAGEVDDDTEGGTYVRHCADLS